jgi:hypothetical protein
MPVVTQSRRAELVITLAGGIRSLAEGRLEDPIVRFRCQTEPLKLYLESDGGVLPVSWDDVEGPELVPLWDSDQTICIWRRSPGAEDFIEFELEAPEDLVRIAVAPRGVLTYEMFFVIEDLGGARLIEADEAKRSRLLRIAEQIGFEEVDRVLELQRQLRSEPRCIERLLAHTNTLQ